MTPTALPEPEPDLPAGLERRLTAALTTAVGRELPPDRLGPYRLDNVDRPVLHVFGGPCDPEYDNSYPARRPSSAWTC